MANGTFGGGDGSAANPWLIEDAADLNAVRTKPVTHYFKLKNNINMDVAPYNSTGWTPIPSYSGVFDGDGYVIKNLKINSPTANRIGLFAELSGTIKDLGMVSVSIVGSEKVGALVGRFAADGAIVDRCYATGTLAGKNLIGGLIGEVNQLNNAVIRDCHSCVNLTIDADFAGGIVGYMTSPFTYSMNKLYYCYYNGTITGGNLLTAAPLCGKVENGDVKDCIYNKEITVQVGTVGSGLTAAEMLIPKKFDNWLYRYRNDKPIWKFLENCSPKLWFQDLGRIIIAYGGKYYTYDATAKAWTWVSDVLPDKDTFWTKGMPDFSGIPIAKFKELDQYGTIDIVNMIESKAQGADTKMKVQLLFDILRNNRTITLTSITENALGTKIPEFNPVARTLSVVQEEEKSNNGMDIDIVSQTEAVIASNNLSDRDNHIDAKSMIFVADTKHEATVVQKSLTLGYSLPGGASEEYKGLINRNRSLQVINNKENVTDQLGVEILSQTESAVDSENLIGLSNHIRFKDVAVASDSKKERDGMAGNALYEIYKTIAKRDRAIKVDTKGEGKSRYLISVNNGGKWLIYDSVRSTWVETELRTIADTGLTMAQLADTSIWGSLPSDYRSKIKYAVGIRNESFNSTHRIQGLDIEFAPNSGPLVQDTQIQVQSDKVILSGVLFDAENDQVEYQVVTKQFNELTWRQITPEQPGWFKRKNGYEFYHEYDLTNFRAGDNSIKVVTRDNRGIVYEKEFQIILITGEPSIELNFQNEFYMNATINHSLGKKIRFRILVNNNQATPVEGYTEWKEAPFSFDFSWDSKDLLYGLPNEITIQAVDELNTIAEIKFHVIGGYRSLLFKDENNFYYSTDKGDILQQLDFGTVIGGLFAEPRVVFLENRTGLTLENVSIWADNETRDEKVKLVLSETLTPFVPVETILLTNTMANGEVKAFYVRIQSEIDVQSIQRKVFKIYAKGDPVVV